MATVEVGASKPVMKYKKYVKPEVSPLIGGVTLNEMTSVIEGLLEDTVELGKGVYQYLYKKCGNGTIGATYYLTENEALYCRRKVKTGLSFKPYVDITVQMFVVIYDEVAIPNKEPFTALFLYEKNPNSRAETPEDSIVCLLKENGTMEYTS